MAMSNRCYAVFSTLLRSTLRHRSPLHCLALSPVVSCPPPASVAPLPSSPPFTSFLGARFLASSHLILSTRSFCSASDAEVPANVVVIKSEKELSDVYKKAEDESLPVIFYFTAEWCGPCHFLWPAIRELSKEIDHVKICKVDIDLDGLGHHLAKLNIYSVPTLHFFSKGKKADEVVGADSKKIRDIASKLYGKET